MKQISRCDDHNMDGNFFNVFLYQKPDFRSKHFMRIGDFIINFFDKGFYLRDNIRFLGILSSDIFPISHGQDEYHFNARQICHRCITDMPPEILFNYLHFYAERNQHIGMENNQILIKKALGLI